jgi:hypothetical protein
MNLGFYTQQNCLSRTRVKKRTFFREKRKVEFAQQKGSNAIRKI